MNEIFTFKDSDAFVENALEEGFLEFVFFLSFQCINKYDSRTLPNTSTMNENDIYHEGYHRLL